MLKATLRSFLLVLLGGAFLLMMQRLGLLRVSDILTAVQTRPLILIALAATQCAAAFVMMIRYSSLLSVLGISVPLKQVSSATFVSTAVGQWLPGSLAFVEVLRVSLMLGSHAEKPAVETSTGENFGLKSRLAIASFADRLVGFLGILLAGFIFSVVLFLRAPVAGNQVDLLSGPGLLLLSSGLGTVVLASLPFVSRLRFFRHFEKNWKVTGGSSRTRFGALWNQILRHLEVLRHNVDAGSRHPQRLLRPLLLSMVSLLLTSFSLYLAAHALGESLDFLQIVCAYPLISLSTLLPLGFAGIGGYQLIMASIFGLFSVSPAVVASSGVLQSAVVLVVNTLIGLLYARVCSGQIRAVMKRPIVSQPI